MFYRRLFLHSGCSQIFGVAKFGAGTIGNGLITCSIRGYDPRSISYERYFSCFTIVIKRYIIFKVSVGFYFDNYRLLAVNDIITRRSFRRENTDRFSHPLGRSVHKFPRLRWLVRWNSTLHVFLTLARTKVVPFSFCVRFASSGCRRRRNGTGNSGRPRTRRVRQKRQSSRVPPGAGDPFLILMFNGR